MTSILRLSIWIASARRSPPLPPLSLTSCQSIPYLCLLSAVTNKPSFCPILACVLLSFNPCFFSLYKIFLQTQGMFNLSKYMQGGYHSMKLDLERKLVSIYLRLSNLLIKKALTFSVRIDVI